MKNTVELIGHYGSDETHALSAWTSTSRDMTPQKTERIPDLLTMLAENSHHTPFEKSVLHFLVRCETASHIHILKHRIGVSVNGESGRYKQLKTPTSLIPEDWPPVLQSALAGHFEASVELYEKALAALTPTLGRARAKESARFFLPYSNQLTLDISFNFRSFAHFIELRNKPEAQKEIREIAQSMIEQVRAIEGNPFQYTLAAFGIF